jgi:outer membrane lipoprotein
MKFIKPWITCLSKVTANFLKQERVMRPYFLLLILLLVGCSSIPTNIENPPAYDLSYNYANQDPTRYKNMPVRWGGVIADLENEQNASLLQILTYPLNSYGRPQLDEQPQGRFVVKTTQFLDPLVYSKNSEITIAGTLTGSISRTIDKKTMTMPLVQLTTLYLWPMYDYMGYYNYYDGYYGYYGFGLSGFYSPYYYGYPYHGWRRGYYPYRRW